MSGLRIMGVDDFLSYDSRSRSEFLGAEWKKKGFLNFWLHRRLPFAMGWQHGLPRIDVRDDPETRTPHRVVFSGSYRCLEDDDVLKEQYRRDRETGARKNPPHLCPICLLVEYVHGLVLAGRIHWLQPIFDFDAGDPNTRVVVRAAGMWNGYKPDRLADVQKQEMYDAGISPKFGWKENCQAGLKYILCLVDADQPAKGVQVMKEGQAAGDKVKLAIQKEMKRSLRNPGLGDPVKNPYPFCLEYKENESPDRKYDAYRVDIPLDAVVNGLISETDAPDISMLAGNYQPATLRAQLERAAQIELPWDTFFTPDAEAQLSAMQEEQVPSPAPLRASQPASFRVPPRPQPVASSLHTSQPLPPPRQALAAPPLRVPEPEMFGCDTCGQPIKATDTVCAHCGMQYEVEAAPAPKPLPLLRRRSELNKPAPVAAPVPTMHRQVVAPAQVPRASAPPVAVESPAGMGESPEDDVGFGDFGADEIPF